MKVFHIKVKKIIPNLYASLGPNGEADSIYICYLLPDDVLSLKKANCYMAFQTRFGIIHDRINFAQFTRGDIHMNTTAIQSHDWSYIQRDYCDKKKLKSLAADKEEDFFMDARW